MYKIEKNIPITNNCGKHRIKYPFGDMDIKDSFFVPLEERKKSTVLNSINNACRQYNRVNKKKIEITTSYNEESLGIRVWRTK
jgi:hypothetical protein